MRSPSAMNSGSPLGSAVLSFGHLARRDDVDDEVVLVDIFSPIREDFLAL